MLRCTIGTPGEELSLLMMIFHLRLVPYLHPQHDIHPNDSWELLARMILNGDIKEDSDSGQIEFQLRGNLNTPRFKPTSDVTIDYRSKM